MALIRGEKEIVADDCNEKIYVAVSQEWKACKSILQWVVDNLKEKRVCLVLVHEPAQYTTLFGLKFPVSSLSEEEAIVHQEKSKQEIRKTLDDYVRICTRAQLQVEKLYVEMESVESGLVELIFQHKIQRLVMGAAADKSYSKKMKEPKSKKANYVREHAPFFCHIWFICKGHLIYTREGIKQLQLNDEEQNWQKNAESRLTRFHSDFSTSPGKVNYLEDSSDQSSTFSLSHLSISYQSSEATTASTSDSTETNDREASFRSLSQLPEPKKAQYHVAKAKSRSQLSSEFTNFPRKVDLEECRDRSSQLPVFYQSSEGATDSSFEHLETEKEASFQPLTLQHKPEQKQHLLIPPKTLEENMDDALYSQLEEAIVEAVNAKKEALGELMRRRKAEKDAIEAANKANEAKNLYHEELRRRKELEEELAKAKGKRKSQKHRSSRHGTRSATPDRRGSGTAAEESS